MSVVRADMSAWKNLFVPEQVLKALEEEKFTTPTPIQALTLPSAIRDKLDIVGAAETGSGKTLAFGIPLLHHILQAKNSRKRDEEEKRGKSRKGGDSVKAEVSEDSDSDAGVRVTDSKRQDLAEKGTVASNRNETADDGSSSCSEDDSVEENLPTAAHKGGFEMSSANVLDLGAGYAVNFDGGSMAEYSDGEEDNLPPDPERDSHDNVQGGTGCVRVLNDVVFEEFVEAKKTSKQRRKSSCGQQQPLLALILTPTRELAVQVKQHIDRVAKYTGVQSCVVVGGLSAQKQRRMLRRQPDIVVATPGRLWELIQEREAYLCNVEKVKYLVIDEADRMVEKGHFQELSQLLALINADEKAKNARQTFVFSATLTLVHGGPSRAIKVKKKKIKELTKESKLDALMSQIGMKAKAKVVDLSRKEGTAQLLVESRITCSKEEKDLYLYYFLLRYPGRTLVFANSKDALRRLASVLALLQCKPLLLHADMRQKQRLKNLDRFKADACGLLLATDVAARGLDIPAVQHVIHFQVPRTSENYVHRSGRTARAAAEGLSVMLVAADDLHNYRKIVKTLTRHEELPLFPVQEEYLLSIRARVSLARQVDKMQHAMDKQKHQNSWFEKAAKEADLEFDNDSMYQVRFEDNKDRQSEQNKQLHSLKTQLQILMKKPITLSNFSGKYPTKSGNIVVPYMRGHVAATNAADIVKNSLKPQERKRKHSSQGRKNQFAKKRRKGHGKNKAMK